MPSRYSSMRGGESIKSRLVAWTSRQYRGTTAIETSKDPFCDIGSSIMAREPSVGCGVSTLCPPRKTTKLVVYERSRLEAD